MESLPFLARALDLSQCILGRFCPQELFMFCERQIFRFRLRERGERLEKSDSRMTQSSRRGLLSGGGAEKRR